MPHLGYEASLRLLRLAAPLLSRGEGKLARGLRGRDEQRGRLENWARENRSPDRPLVWLHAPSVGEGLQARAVARALRASRPEAQLVFTHFSPSAEGFARGMVEGGDIDEAAYLPWDLASEAGRVLDALSPSVVAFTKTEVWPGVVRSARRRGIPVVLVAATLPEAAGRLRFPARFLLRPTFGSLVRVLAISAEDGARFRRLGVRPDRIRVTGDPGIDSAVERADQGVRGIGPLPWEAPLAVFGGVGGGADGERAFVPGLVAGSTWGPDEAVLLDALDRVVARGRVPGTNGGGRPRLLIAPHEPDEAHLAPLEARLDRGGWRHVRLAEVEDRGTTGEADVVVVDRVGVLAHLYRCLPVAYVGGGFHRHGLHSVLEPAAAARPVLHGPRFRNSLAAAELGRAGGARVVDDAPALAEALTHWWGDPARGEAAGASARAWVEGHLGAAARTADALDRWL